MKIADFYFLLPSVTSEQEIASQPNPQGFCVEPLKIWHPRIKRKQFYTTKGNSTRNIHRITNKVEARFKTTINHNTEKLRYTWPINLDKRYLALDQLRLPVKPEPKFSILFEDIRKTKVPWSGPLPTTSLPYG